MLLSVQRGITSLILRVKILDSAATTGAGKTGLTSASAGLIISTIATNEATPTVYAQASSNVETITTLGTFAAPTASKCRFKEVDATNHKGVYEIQIADARLAVANSRDLLVSISGASGAAETDFIVQLTDFNPYDVVRAGLTSLPNAAAQAAGGLFTRGTGAGQINQDANGRVDVNVEAINNLATALAGFEAFFNGTGFNASASNIGTVGSVTAIANGAITAAKFATGALDANALATDAVTEIVNAILAAIVEDKPNTTLQGALSLCLAFAAGRTTGGGVVFNSPDNSEARITATVDGSNNRTSITNTPATV